MSTTVTTTKPSILISTCLSKQAPQAPQAPTSLVLVQTEADLAPPLFSDKVYLVDGSVTITQPIEVPSGGLSIVGYTFDISKLISNEDNFTLFTSPVGGSGNLLGTDIAMEVTGANSQVFDLTSASGFDAFEFTRVNWNNCTSLGEIANYRQGFESGTGRFGGSPNLTLTGPWVGGYFIDSSIIRNLDVAMVGALYQAGPGFTMQSRFRSNQNLDLPSNAAFLDFSEVNFPNPSTLQIEGATITRGLISNAADVNLTPNITKANLSCAWRDNFGIGNTFVGGTQTVSDEIETVISLQNAPADLEAETVTSELEHFDAPNGTDLRHLGDDPREYKIVFDFVLEGGQNREYRLDILKSSPSSFDLITFSQTRVINNLQGGRDVAYFTGSSHITLDKNESVRWTVINLSGNQNCTLEASSSWSVEAR